MQFDIEHERLKKIVNHAYTTTSFYINSADGNPVFKDENISWESIPLTKKEDIVLSGDSFISSRYLSQYIMRKLLRVPTSGSTGKCVDIYWNSADNFLSLMPLLLKRKKYYNINSQDRHCYFYTGRIPGKIDKEAECLDFEMGFCKSNLNEEKLIRIWDEMRKFKPTWLILQPSMASLLCKIVETNELEPIADLRYAEITGEMLFPSERERIETILHVKVANQYGCNEMNSIAYECPEGYLHCMESNVLVEILDENGEAVSNGEEGEIYITTLTNYAMPLIRYQIGDRGRLMDHQCKCGSKERIMELTKGRSNDWVIDNEGKQLNTYIFLRCIENINMMYENVIHQFQIIQHQIGKFTVNLVTDEEFAKSDIINLFLENLWQTSLSGAEYNFVFFAHLFPDNSFGKLKWFINEMISV